MISVCMATYNGARYIREQIESILCQLSPEDELIISDDGSTDETLEIVESFQDERICVCRNECQKGPAGNFENALLQSHGNYIFLSDQDDVWMPNKVSKMLNALTTNDFAVSDAVVVNQDRNTISESFFVLRGTYKSFLGDFVKFGYLGCCFAFRRKLLVRALPFPKNHQLANHDHWIFLIALLFYKITIINEPLMYYRRHGTNHSNAGRKSVRPFYFQILYRLYLYCAATGRLFSRTVRGKE